MLGWVAALRARLGSQPRPALPAGRADGEKTAVILNTSDIGGYRLEQDVRYERNPDYIFRKIVDEMVLVPITRMWPTWTASIR